jgi:hypothetical protein
MRFRLALIAALYGSSWTGGVMAAPQAQGQSNERKAPQGKAQTTSLSGCIDEQDGRYVLIHDQTRALIANLEADGFPTEGFARHLGHKVTVRGTANSNGADGSVFKVRSVETVSDTCGPQEDSRVSNRLEEN